VVPDNTPGRSGSPNSSIAPRDAFDRHTVHPASAPIEYRTAADNQPVAVRPCTGTTTNTITSPQAAANPATPGHHFALNAHSTGPPATSTAINWGPVNPKNHPTRSFAYSLNTTAITKTSVSVLACQKLAGSSRSTSGWVGSGSGGRSSEPENGRPPVGPVPCTPTGTGAAAPVGVGPSAAAPPSG